jgi:Tol biopolymer transport system component
MISSIGIFQGRLAAIVFCLSLPFILGMSSGNPKDLHVFGIYTCTLDGGNLQVLTRDRSREMNHARVSPDHQWITFTRYNRRGPSGLAIETEGYQETEIMIMRPDGTGLESLVPPRRGVVAANGYWTPDGKAILYVSNDNPQRRGQINRIDLATRRITRVDLPEHLWMADPHPVGEKLAFTVYRPEEKINFVWLRDSEGGGVRQLTHPVVADVREPLPVHLGDFDPKISPEGSRVVVFRHVDKQNWHMVIVDVETGAENDISDAVALDMVPEWSSDGELLIFWHVDLSDLRNSGLYTVRPDGTDRRKVPLPGGYFYNMPAFFPGEGSGEDARIIFSAKRDRRFLMGPRSSIFEEESAIASVRP